MLAWYSVSIDTFEIWIPNKLKQLFTDSMSSFLVIHSCKSYSFKAHLSEELWSGSGVPECIQVPSMLWGDSESLLYESMASHDVYN